MLGNLNAWRWAWRVETKPLWCTEFGILQSTCRFRDMPRVVQTDCITRMMRYAQAGGCEVGIWYAADQHDMGLGTDVKTVLPDGSTEFSNSVATWNSWAL
jgi:hypothetical protein